MAFHGALVNPVSLLPITYRISPASNRRFAGGITAGQKKFESPPACSGGGCNDRDRSSV